MTTLDARPLRSDATNTDILNAIRKHSSTAYQSRIPMADKGNLQDTIHNLVNFRPAMNEFTDALVNRIGLEIFKYNTWTNPLAKFKRGMLEYGDTIEEVITGLLEAKTYDSDREYLEKDLFGQERPEVQSSFHKVNRQDYYKITVNEPLLKRAFLSDSGLSNFVGQLMEAPTTSDNWDEYLLMTRLLREYYDADGFVKVQIGDLGNVTSDGTDARYALRRLRELAGNLSFISRDYNAAGMPVAASADELELIVTPEANAAIDVEALAAAFNVDYAAFDSRKTIIRAQDMAIPGAQAILTTKDFFVAADQRIETTSVYNPIGLHNNYFLHHWEVVSASRFVPAVLLTTEAPTPIVIEDYKVTSIANITITDEDDATVTTVARGGLYQLAAPVTTDNAEFGTNSATRFTLTGNESLKTRITRTGVLSVSLDEASEALTVTAIAVDSDPINPITTSETITVVGDLAILWPNPEVFPDADNDGLLEVTPAPIVKAADNTVTIPSVVGVQYKQDGTNVANGTVIPITASTTFTAVARAGYELATGATASWTIA